MDAVQRAVLRIAGEDRTVLVAACAGVALLIAISLLFGAPSSDGSKTVGAAKVPRSPSSAFSSILNPLRFLADSLDFLNGMRDLFPEGIFSFRMFGKEHVFLHNPDLSIALLHKPSSAADAGLMRADMIRKAFGFTRADAELYHRSRADFAKPLSLLATEPTLSNIMDKTVSEVKAHVADFVTFNSAPADQMDWESLAGAEVGEDSKGEAFVEVDLSKIVANFIGRTKNTALFGTDFMENFPDIWGPFEPFDAGFRTLISQVPSWIPMRARQRALAARRKILKYTREFNEAMDKYLDGEDPGVRWQDMDNVSEIMKERAKVYRKLNMSMETRAGGDLGILWATNANTNMLTVWMLFEICRDTVILEQIREEIAPYIQIVEEENHFGSAVWLPPKIKVLDMQGLITKCPLLKAAYIETLRLYTSTWSVRLIQEDMVVESKKGNKSSFFIKKDSIAHVPQELHQMNPEVFDDPQDWRPERHISAIKDEQGNLVKTADLGTLRPYGKLFERWTDQHYDLYSS